MSPSTETTQPQTAAELIRSIEEAREALAAAERELGISDAAVESARERQGLGLAVRGATIRAQVARARKQETMEIARGRLKGLDKLLLAAREAAEAQRARAAAERGTALRAEGAAISLRLGDTLARFRAELDAFEVEIREHNGQVGLPTFYRLRPPSAFQLVHDHLLDSINRLQTVYPPAAQPTATINTEVPTHD